MSHLHREHKEKGKGPFLTDTQKKEINWELWCIVRQGKVDIKVYNYDGFAFRNHVDVGAIGGVNGCRDKYLRDDEIGIERMVEEKDEVAFLHHELYERQRMEGGAKYDPAHDAANNAEAEYRRTEFDCKAPHITD